jgi:DNA polymerase-1
MQFLVAKYSCPFASKKLIYAKAFKAKNTFCKNVDELSALDGFLHTNYNQHGTSTGRLSGSDENMQNIPKKLAGVNIKKVFVTDDDTYLFVNADAKGAEVRILTAYCQDTALIASLNDGQDTHCFIASKIIELVRQSPNDTAVLASMNLDNAYPLTYEDFSKRDKLKESNKKYGEMLDKFRTAVKRVVFGILYGAGPTKIAETIGISFEQAKELIDMLFKMFPSIKTYMAQTRWELRTFGFVETFFGRRRRFSVEGAPPYLMGKAERQTVNFKIQSTSSDIVMGRLVAMEKPLEDLGGRILLTVHDSIGFQIPKKYARQLPDFIYTYLEKGAAKQHPWLPVAFKWDYEVGPSYGELRSLETYLANAPITEYSNDAAEAYTEEEVRTELATE